MTDSGCYALKPNQIMSRICLKVDFSADYSLFGLWIFFLQNYLFNQCFRIQSPLFAQS